MIYYRRKMDRTEKLLILAALLVFLGVRKVKKVRGPERAIQQGREIPRALKGQA